MKATFDNLWHACFGARALYMEAPRRMHTISLVQIFEHANAIKTSMHVTYKRKSPQPRRSNKYDSKFISILARNVRYIFIPFFPRVSAFIGF